MPLKCPRHPQCLSQDSASSGLRHKFRHFSALSHKWTLQIFHSVFLGLPLFLGVPPSAVELAFVLFLAWPLFVSEPSNSFAPLLCFFSLLLTSGDAALSASFG